MMPSLLAATRRVLSGLKIAVGVSSVRLITIESGYTLFDSVIGVSGALRSQSCINPVEEIPASQRPSGLWAISANIELFAPNNVMVGVTSSGERRSHNRSV